MPGKPKPPLDSELIAQADAVWRIAVHLLSDQDQASECYQQTFVDAMRLDPSSVRCWNAVMRQIATRRAMDLLRKKYRERDRQSLSDVAASTQQPPESQLMHEELRESVRSVLATLPPNQAEAFWMRHIEKMSATEIGKRLDIEPGHVRVLVHRAIVELRKRLGATYASSSMTGEEK